MIGSGKAGELEALALKFRSVGLGSDAALQSVLELVNIQKAVRSRDIIVAGRCASTQLTVLLAGVTCLRSQLEDGNRQIYSFQYPGDFCDLHRYALPQPDQKATVEAVTECSIGTIQYDDMDRLLSKYPELGLAFWRAAMLEASVFRERLLNISRRAALPRVASIICEHLARLEAVNIKSAVIPFSQVDLADAAGLSVVHVSRVIQDLRKLGILSRKNQTIEVESRERLAQLANFDGRYLNMRDLLCDWQVDIEP